VKVESSSVPGQVVKWHTYIPLMAWNNWARNQHCNPAVAARPRSVDELQSIIRDAREQSRRVRPVGSSHSFSKLAVCDDVQISMRSMPGRVDVAGDEVTVSGNVTLAELNAELWRHGRALPVLGDIDEQTVAGAIATGTHGTGRSHGSLASLVQAMTIIDGNGAERTFTREDGALLDLACIGLGVLGVTTSVTLGTVPAFYLRSVEERVPVAEVLDQLDSLVDSAPHFEFFWFPHTKMAVVKRHYPETSPPTNRMRLARAMEELLLENAALGLLCAAGNLRSGLIPPGMRLAARIAGNSTYVGRSFDVFTTPRLVRFVEMEYAVPLDAVESLLASVAAIIDRHDLRISFPVEVRVTPSENAALSTSFGSQRAHIAFHAYAKSAFQPYFRLIEPPLQDVDGRPHWGKHHSLRSSDLACRYPHWALFQELRSSCDPADVFTTPYIKELLGPAN
jgi:L-gulono-1,4-lactone dehydrogenase